MLGNEQDAQEAAQEALLKAYRSRNRYDPSRPFYPWLYRIMKNTCLDAMSRRTHGAATGLDTERVAASQLNAFDKIHQEQSIERLKYALEELPEDQREIINLRHFQGLTYSEIAALLEIAEGTVMSRLYRARKALVSLLEERP